MGTDEWLKCRSCRQRLAPVVAHEGRTAIVIEALGFRVLMMRAEITCPVCGTVRQFSSVPVKTPGVGSRPAAYPSSVNLTRVG